MFRTRFLTLALTVITAAIGVGAQPVAPGGRADAVRFAVLGDFGTGERPQYEVAQQLWATRTAFPYEFVLLVGDNMYGSQQPTDFVAKFDRPYEPLLKAGIPFYAALGNHDKQDNRNYPPYGMRGDRYYTFVKQHVRFVVLDTNLMDDKQLAWLESTLAAAREPWKIMNFHHPIYSDGARHGSNVELRVVLEPIFVRYGVQVAFTGHEHFYERTTPQKGITYFIAGSGGQLRKGDVRRSAMTAAAFDQDRAFMVVEIDGDDMRYTAIARDGRTVDGGVIRRSMATTTDAGRLP